MRILYFAPIYFDDLKQRPQQLAECLSKHHQVYYVEPTVSWIRWFLKRGRKYQHCYKKISDSLTVIRLSGRFTFHKSVEAFDLIGCNNWSEYLQIKQLATRCDLIWTGYPGWYTLLRHFKGKPVVYDRMDEEELLANSWMLKLALRRNKKMLLRRSDLVFASCVKFYEEWKGKKPIYLVPNALPDSFIQLNVECQSTGELVMETSEKNRNEYRSTGGLVFGYVGTIGKWFDFDVIKYILKLSRNCKIILVGKNMMPVFNNKRVIYLDAVSHEELPRYICSFDVCLYNFKQDEILDTVNPVKLYEYLAMNRPVLAVRSKETIYLRKYIMIYQKASDIRCLLESGIRKPFSSQKEYMDFILKNTWKNRADTIEQALDSLYSVRNGKTAS